MKELDSHNKAQQTEIHAIKPVKDSGLFVERLRPKPGQKVWELNTKTKIIREAIFADQKAVLVPEKHLITKRVIGTTTQIYRDVIKNENCEYCCSLNYKSADKQFAKILGIKYPKGAKPKRNE